MLTLCINFSFIRQKCLGALATFSEVPRCPFSFKIMKIALVPGLFEENPRQFPSCPPKVALPLPTFILRPAQGVEFWHAKMKTGTGPKGLKSASMTMTLFATAQ